MLNHNISKLWPTKIKVLLSLRIAFFRQVHKYYRTIVRKITEMKSLTVSLKLVTRKTFLTYDSRGSSKHFSFTKIGKVE